MERERVVESGQNYLPPPCRYRARAITGNGWDVWDARWTFYPTKKRKDGTPTGDQAKSVESQTHGQTLDATEFCPGKKKKWKKKGIYFCHQSGGERDRQ